MAWPATRRRMKAALMLTDAMRETREADPAVAAACNGRLSKARDRMLWGPPATIGLAPVLVDPVEYEELREEGVAELRRHCADCGLCARFGLVPP